MKKWLIPLLAPMILLGAFLSVDEAFKPSVSMEKRHFHVKIKIADHIHLSKKALKFAVEPAGKIELGGYALPPAQKDEFGDEVYSGIFELDIPFDIKDDSVGQAVFVLGYQGCSDRGICYPPVEKRFKFSLKSPQEVSSKAATLADTKSGRKSAAAGISEEQSIADTLKTKSFGIVMLTFFGFGLLLALTPCIFPMIPILSSIIVAQGEGMTARRGLALSLVYVFFMALTYAIAGIVAGLFGANLQAALQNPWAISAFALLFVALAFSMFGFYELQLPAYVQSKLSRTSSEAGKKGGLAGVAIMGFLSALIVGPCVAPPLAGALIYIGQTGDAFLGGMALFVMGLGMGVPLLLIGVGAGKFMPKPGGWMTIVSNIFGVVMLGVAIWMLSRIIPGSVTLGLWALLFIIGAVYMGAFEPLEEKRSWDAFWKGLGIVMAAYGLMLLFGAFTGASNPLDPLKVLKEQRLNIAPDTASLHFERVSSLEDLLKTIERSEKPVMVDFRADWCVSCKELEESTFKDPKVIEALKGYRLLQVDVTENGQKDKEMMEHFGIFGPPAIIFFENGREIASKRISGYKSAEEFVSIVKKGRQ